MESVTTIDSVDPKQVKTKYGVKTVWNVSCADGRLYSTFKDEIGKTAGTLRGQTVTVSFSERPWQKDDKSGVNYDLDDVKAAEGLTEAPTGRLVLNGEPTATASVSTGVVTHNLTTKKPEAPWQPYVDEKSKQINRSVAFKAAVELIVAGFYAAEPGVDGLTRTIAELTEELIPVVEGTTPAPLPVASPTQDTGGTGEIVDNQGNLVNF